MCNDVRYRYHFEPKKGWMNDPNGLVWFKGYYHAFFQHNPYAAHWDKMHWGHAVSTDLIHWDECDIALYPDMPYEDEGGCYSGSAIVKDDILYLFYTSVSAELGQTQSVAMSSDGFHFTKYEGNPVIAAFPADGSKEFRDPMVFRNPMYDAASNSSDNASIMPYGMVIGSDHDGHGRVLMYVSEDLLHWQYSHVLYESKDYELTIECPNFFPLGDKYVLMYCRMNYDAYSVRFVIGDFDGRNFVPQSECTPEAGPQFYAPQTFEAPDGRRIMIGWYYDWHRKVDEAAEYAGAFTIPRELTCRNNRIYSFPVAETAPLLTVADKVSGDIPCPVRPEVIHELHDTKGVEIFVNKGEWVTSIVY